MAHSSRPTFNQTTPRLAASTSAALFIFLTSHAIGAEPVVLRIDGKTADGRAVELTMADLEQMKHTVIETSTPWHDHVVEFEGVLLSDLMTAVGAEGQNAFVVALNEYTADVPVSDFTDFNPILALRQDGQPMPIGDKGPSFIVYPYDDNKELQSEKYYLRSVWSVASITIE
jgi:hypothetical protein